MRSGLNGNEKGISQEEGSPHEEEGLRMGWRNQMAEQEVNCKPGDTTSGHAVSSRSPRHGWGTGFAKAFRHGNKPLPVTVIGGLIVLFVSNYVQGQYWLSQHRFLLSQARADRLWAGSLSAEDEIVKAVARRLTASAMLINAYENDFGETQLLQIVKQHNLMITEWDQSRVVMNLRIATYFTDKETGNQWQRLRDDIVALKEGVGQLALAAKPARASQTATCWQLLTKAEADADTLVRKMIQYAEAKIAPRD